MDRISSARTLKLLGIYNIVLPSFYANGRTQRYGTLET